MFIMVQYKNVRPDYLKNIWKVINWKYASGVYETALNGCIFGLYKYAPISFHPLSLEIKAFDDSKAGVKGLVDSGVKRVPRMFHSGIDITENKASRP